MNVAAETFTLAELLIVAVAEAFRTDREILGSGIGVVPRIGVGLAKLTHSPGLMLTDGEAYLVEDPVPLGVPPDKRPPFSGYMSYARVFDVIWSGRRHVMVGPMQIDRWGQANLSGMGLFVQPKLAMLGMRGLPGNSINHTNSMFVPNHSTRVFVEGEVDIVGGVGYRAARWMPGQNRGAIDHHRIVTDLCVLDFGGPDHAVRVRSLHPGVSFDAAQRATGFPLIAADDLAETPAPSAEEMRVIAALDPKNARASALKGNPPGRRG